MSAPASTPVKIGQILRKDLRLLWPLAAFVLGCQLLAMLLTARGDPFGPTPLAYLFSTLFAIGGVVLILMVVQQDPVPGVGQDWLVRPIRRRDLILAKLLFVVAVLHAPLVVTGLAHGLWDGFSFGESLRAALVRNLCLLLTISLPLVTFAALTRNLTAAIIGALAALALLAAVLLLLVGVIYLATGAPDMTSPTIGSGIAWVCQTLALGVLLTGLTTVLALLYARRRVAVAWIVLLVALLASFLALMLPWEPAFALQSWLARSSSSHRHISVAFDRSVPPVPEPAWPKFKILQVPLRFSDVAPGTIVYVDRLKPRVLDAQGKIVYDGAGVHLIAPFTPDGPMPPATVLIPTPTYDRLQDLTVRLEVEVFMTALHARALQPLPALGGEGHLAGVGRCATRMDEPASQVELACIAADEPPACLSVVPARSTGVANPPTHLCFLDYAPWRTHLSLDAISHIDASLPFRNPVSQAPFPVDGSQLRDAAVKVTLYEPVDHLVRSIVIPQVRLRDLAPPPSSMQSRAGPPRPRDPDMPRR
jgi:hypothetical protein